MSEVRGRILVVDDHEGARTTLALLLRGDGYDVVQADSGESALKIFTGNNFDLVITDLFMGEIDGMRVLEEVKKKSPDTEVIIITAFGTIENAVQAMRNGAYHYITKPPRPDEVLLTVEKALERKKVLKELNKLKALVQDKLGFENIIGTSAELQEVLKIANMVADTDSTILITGESGTGKELIAKAIHYRSRRKDKPFIVVNAGAIPDTLLESELFGHIRGAFTGAVSTRKGLLEEADTGTFFLDEVGDIPFSLQVKLLRFLEDGTIRKIGDNVGKQIDVRFIAATNRNLKKLVNEGNFREDLYYRLNVIEINIPPLRERKEDIQPLAYYFLHKFSQKFSKNVREISDHAMMILMNYSWPGNVRELENCIERAVILANGDVITPRELPNNLTKEDIDFSKERIETLEECEKRYIKFVLERCQWNQKKATEILGISKSTLWRKMKLYNIPSKKLI